MDKEPFFQIAFLNPSAIAAVISLGDYRTTRMAFGHAFLLNPANSCDKLKKDCCFVYKLNMEG